MNWESWESWACEQLRLGSPHKATTGYAELGTTQAISADAILDRLVSERIRDLREVAQPIHKQYWYLVDQAHRNHREELRSWSQYHRSEMADINKDRVLTIEGRWLPDDPDFRAEVNLRHQQDLAWSRYREQKSKADHAATLERQDEALERGLASLSEQQQALLAGLWSRAILHYPEYLKAITRIDQIFEQSFTERRQRCVVTHFARLRLADHFDSTDHTPDRAGYRTYLYQAAADFYDDVLGHTLPARVSNAERRQHTYIVGKSGCGKSELLKALVYAQVSDPSAGVVVIDPKGDLADQITRWPEHILSGRLVVIDPFLHPEFTPTLNPFDAAGLSPQERTKVASELVGALEEIIKGEGAMSLTHNMVAFLKPCCRLLLELPGATLETLEQLLNDDPELVKQGEHSPLEREVATFFRTTFQHSYYTVTKQTLVTKIGSLLNSGVLPRLTCGPSTFDLKQLMNQHKIIVFRLSDGAMGPMERNAFGRLVVAQVQGIAQAREALPDHYRPMTHLIIDECQNFITKSVKTIVNETRKYGLAATLVQLTVAGEMDAETAKAVTQSTNVRIMGQTGRGTESTSAALVGTEANEVSRLRKGQFLFAADVYPTFTLSVRTDLLGNRHQMLAWQWEQLRRWQLDLYYRPLDATRPGSQIPPEDIAPERDAVPVRPVKQRKRVLD